MHVTQDLSQQIPPSVPRTMITVVIIIFHHQHRHRRSHVAIVVEVFTRACDM